MRRSPSVPLVVVTAVAFCVVASTLLAAGVAALSGTAGTSVAPTDLGELRGPAAPGPWRAQEATSVAQCPGMGWEVLGSLGWLATGSGRHLGSPPWWAWPGGLFGLVPGEA
ncbi:MAG: hypothetical protein WCI12_04155, partial [Actinomycetes bacterium]